MESRATELQPGDLVRLKEPFRGRYGYGIVVLILSHAGGRRDGHPRNVSLHLFDDQGQLYIEPCHIARGLMVPCYVGFHVSELIWYRRAAESGYCIVSDPPDWSDRRYGR